MRSGLSAILVFEAIVVALAIPVAVSQSDVHSGLAMGVGFGLAAGCIAATALMRLPAGRVLGSALQVITFALGFVVPVMFALGLIFGGLWFWFLVLDRKLVAADAAHTETTGDPPSRPS